MDLKQVGPWIIEKELGAGGMGTVYLGKHTETSQLAAVKVLPPSLAREEGFIERFKREIVSMEKLKSPHIVEFFESGNEGDTYYYAMEHVDGETLTARLRRDKRIPWPEVIDLSLQICRALKAAHNGGIVHRDLKPSNLLIASDGTIKLTDFGVAQVFAAQKLTITGGIVGTAEYMSPEQAKGQRATKKSDLYSLGAVIYVMLTGRPPFSGKTILDVIHKHQFGQFDRPGLIATDIPKPLEEIVCKLLEKDPDKRFPDAYVLSLRLAEVQKRVAWVAAAKQASAAAVKVGVDDATEASEHARPPLDNTPLAATIITDPRGQSVPIGPTIAIPGSGQEPPPELLHATITAPSLSQHTSELARTADRLEQGPGTIMRNLMRAVIDEQQSATILGRLLNNTWILVTALVLLIAAGVYWIPSQELSDDDRFAEGERLANLPEGSDWIRAKNEYFMRLRQKDQNRWAVEVDPYLEEIEFYEEMSRRRRELKKDAPVSKATPVPETERMLRLVVCYYDLGDFARAEGMLAALLPLLEAQDKFIKEKLFAQKLLNVIRARRSDTREAHEWLFAEIKRAEQLTQDNRPAEARSILKAIVQLYDDDPMMETIVQIARQALHAVPDSSSDSTTTSKSSPSPQDAASQADSSSSEDVAKPNTEPSRTETP